MAPSLELIQPTLRHLTSFLDALDRGWDPPGTTADAVRARITQDAAAFVAELDDRDGRGAPITLPDGTVVPRLPSVTRWIWDGEFAGRISLRWQPGTVELPPTCLGHIGYVVVPWRRRRGYATFALSNMLNEARALGLPYVELTTDPENTSSQRVIAANGGVLWERFTKPAAYGGGVGLRYRISLAIDS
jgi:predicted acetyltransferase